MSNCHERKLSPQRHIFPSERGSLNDKLLICLDLSIYFDSWSLFIIFILQVFADHESSLKPIDVPRDWIWDLPRRTVYFGTSVTSIFKGKKHSHWSNFNNFGNLQLLFVKRSSWNVLWNTCRYVDRTDSVQLLERYTSYTEKHIVTYQHSIHTLKTDTVILMQDSSVCEDSNPRPEHLARWWPGCISRKTKWRRTKPEDQWIEETALLLCSPLNKRQAKTSSRHKIK